MFHQREDITAVGPVVDFLPSGANVATVKFLPFLSAFLRERCTRLSSDEEEKVEAYIEEQEALAVESRDHPWALEDEFEDDPLLAENKYIQQYVSLCNFCHDRSLMRF